MRRWSTWRRTDVTDHERRMQALREAVLLDNARFERLIADRARWVQPLGRLEMLPDPPRSQFVGQYMPGIRVVSPAFIRVVTPLLEGMQPTPPRAESFSDWLARSADLLEECAKRRRGPNEV